MCDVTKHPERIKIQDDFISVIDVENVILVTAHHIFAISMHFTNETNGKDTRAIKENHIPRSYIQMNEEQNATILKTSHSASCK